MIPYGRQTVDASDIAAVVRVLEGDWLTQGPHVEEFEQALAAYTGARHAVAFASGTAALHAAVLAAELGPGSRVVTSPLSFVASANCARYAGAEVRFADIDSDTLNLDPRRVPECDGIVAVHYAGLPTDLRNLAHRPRVVIEDAAHALGSETPDGRVGNCARSDMCVFSFHPVKTITTAEGGAVTASSPELADRLRRIRHHGIGSRPERGGWYYEIESLGFNYRMSDIHAALGTSQLRRAEEFVARRNHLAGRYREALAGLSLRLPPPAPTGWRHAYHLFAVRVPGRRRVFDALRAAGIGVQVHYIPIYRHRLYVGRASDPALFPGTEAAYEDLLSLPLYPRLTEREQDFVVETLASVL